MSSTPKKLAVTNIGLSEDTFFLQFELESQDASDNIPMGLIASIGDEAEGQGFNLGASYPPNEVINLMSIFSPSSNSPTIDTSAIVSFTFVNTTNGTINYGDINYEVENHYDKLTQVEPKNIPLDITQEVVFQCARNEGLFAFLCANASGGTPYSSAIFISSNPYFDFVVTEQSADKKYYMIQVKESGEFLIVKDGVIQTGTSTDPTADNSFLWCFEKDNDSPLCYSICNVESKTYLSAKMTNSKIELTDTPCPWYLHINEQ